MNFFFFSFFRATQFIHVPRACNQGVHELAKETIHTKVKSVWLKDIPPSIFIFIWRELSRP